MGPRDGLQNEPRILPTHIKIELINQLSKTGLQTIEATRYVLYSTQLDHRKGSKKKKKPPRHLPTGYNTTYTGYNKIEKYVSRTSLYDEIFMIPIVV